jgi:hypothetical protein
MDIKEAINGIENDKTRQEIDLILQRIYSK